MAKSRAKPTSSKTQPGRGKVVSRGKAAVAAKLTPAVAKGRLRAVVSSPPSKTVPPPKAVAAEKPTNSVRRVRNGAAPETSAKADGLKARFAQLSSATSQISGLKRAMSKNFFEVGQILNRIRDERLFEVKGYGSFESFVEREIDLNKVVCLRSARIAEAMIRDVALEAGLERASAAVAALDGESIPTASITSFTGPSGTVLPFHKQ